MLSTVVDDAYISARYADHLVNGNALVYNVGEPVEGITNLSWTLYLAGASMLGVDTLAAMVGGGLICALLALVAATLLTWTLLPVDRRLLAGLPALLLGCDPHLASVATNGLESTLVVLLVLVLPLALARAPLLAAVVGPVLVWTRPEGAVIVAGLLGAEGLHRRRDSLRPVIVPAATSAVAFILVVGLRLMIYGRLVPNTFSAKASASMWELLPANVRYLHASGIFWEVAGLILLVAAGFLWRRWRIWGLAGVAGGGVLLALQVPLWMPGGRLLLPSLALTAVVGVVALGAHWQPSPRGLVGLTSITLVGAALVSWQVGSSVRMRDIAHSVSPGAGAQVAALHLRRHLEDDSVVAIRDAGVFAYRLGPAIRVAELHERALTVPHPGGRDAVIADVLEQPPEAVITTVNRRERPSLYYKHERSLRTWLRSQGASYAYLGRVRQHVRRYYDVYVRTDLDVPPLPEAVVVNRLGPAL